MTYIIGSPEFIKNLDGWLFKNEKKYADYIASNTSKIPPMFVQYAKPLYRGMIVNEDFLNKISGSGVVFNEPTSWTKDEKLAKAFTQDPKYKTGKYKGTPILIKKMVSKTFIAFDIHSFVMFMGNDQLEMLGMDSLSVDSAISEQEVLIKKGVKIVQKDVTFL